MAITARRRIFQGMTKGSALLLAAAAIQAQVAPSVPKVPEALLPPKGQDLLMQWNGKGKQIYVCRSTGGEVAWRLKAPDAKLFAANGDLAGRHSAGPTWEANDRSRVTGQLAASVPSSDSHSIPWLLLSAKSHAGNGVMNRVQTIQRLNTEGGKAPDTGCGSAREVGNETEAPYEALYRFYGSR